MEPTTIIAAASVAQGVMGFKGNRAAARQAQAVAEYNAQVRENELVLTQRARRDQEAALRKQSERLVGVQRVSTAKSGIQMSGSALQALADTYFNTERDAQRIQYAASVDMAQAESEAAMSRIAGKAQASAYNTAAFGSLLGAAGGFASARQQERILGQQQALFELQQTSMQRRLGE
jgi:hypothetical protein